MLLLRPSPVLTVNPNPSLSSLSLPSIFELPYPFCNSIFHVLFPKRSTHSDLILSSYTSVTVDIYIYIFLFTRFLLKCLPTHLITTIYVKNIYWNGPYCKYIALGRKSRNFRSVSTQFKPRLLLCSVL